MNGKPRGVARRAFLSVSAAAAAAVSSRLPAGAAERGIGEKYSLTACPWTPENPRHDHQQIFLSSRPREIAYLGNEVLTKSLLETPFLSASSGECVGKWTA